MNTDERVILARKILAEFKLMSVNMQHSLHYPPNLMGPRELVSLMTNLAIPNDDPSVKRLGLTDDGLDVTCFRLEGYLFMYQWDHGSMIAVLEDETSLPTVCVIAFSLEGKLEMLAARASINT
jgi:hypothetical protein